MKKKKDAKTKVKGLNRRQFLKGTAVGGLALASGPMFFTRKARASAAKNTVRVIGLETAVLPEWSVFEKETGLKMEWHGLDSDPGLFIKEVVANEAGDYYDLFIFDGGLEDKLGPEGYFLPIDEGAMKLWSKIPDSIKRSPLLQSKDGTQYGAPQVYNADSFAYYPDDIGEPEPLSYKLLFDSEKTQGKVALEDTWLTTLPMAALYLKKNNLAKIANPSNMTPGEAKQTVDFLIKRKQAGQFRALWRTWEESVDLLGNREVIVENCWEPAVKELQRKGKKVRYATTVEGYNKWMQGAYVPTQAEKRGTLENAYKTIDWFLGGSYGALIAVLRGYATASPDLALKYAKDNKWSKDKIQAIQENIYKVEKKFEADLFWQDANPDHIKEIEAEWQRFVQA